NFKFTNLNTFGIVFRYKNAENYYGIQIVPNSREIRLIKRINSTPSIISSTKVNQLHIGGYYKCSLLLDFDHIQFLFQDEMAREHKVLFDKVDKDIARGGFGLAINGNSDVMFTGIETDEYK